MGPKVAAAMVFPENKMNIYLYFNSHPANWSVEKGKKETKRDCKNYHELADLAHTKKQTTTLKSRLSVS